jgi:hypothetical protein
VIVNSRSLTEEASTRAVLMTHTVESYIVHLEALQLLSKLVQQRPQVILANSSALEVDPPESPTPLDDDLDDPLACESTSFEVDHFKIWEEMDQAGNSDVGSFGGVREREGGEALGGVGWRDERLELLHRCDSRKDISW